ncbi:MAG: ACT domain-containing protein, partial [Clostridia bacterium]|nr:ACT domain-containing protein [Clostridia bacterium]
MRNIITVMGIDKTGIIAKVSGCLYRHGVNILDINQTIMQNIFTMIMLVDLKDSS